MTNRGAHAGEVDVVVVGAGAAGIVAARRLAGAGHAVVVLERERHTGGRVQTEQHDGCYLEHGGIFHTRGYPATRALLAEVGMTDRITPTATGFHGAVRDRGDWSFVDFGSVGGPLRTRALGWRDKLSIVRAAAPALLARPSDPGDLTSLRRLDTHAATRDLTDRAAGYFTAGPHEFLWGMPSDRLSYAMLAQQLHVFTGDLCEIRGGTGPFLAALAEGLDVRHGTTVARVEPDDDGVAVHLEGGDPVRARAVILACQADVSAALWAEAPAPVAEHLRATEYSRIDYAYLRTREAVELRAEGRPVGMEVVTTPEVAGGTIGGVYVADAWTESGGLWLVTAAHAAHAEDLDDETLGERLQADAEKLHPELVGQVTERVVMRHRYYTPIVTPGSVTRAASVREHLPHRRVDLAGDHMTAPWMEGAVRSGEQAADRVAAALR